MKESKQMKDVVISIIGTQTLDETDRPDVIELVTDGQYSHSPEETVLTYQESELTGLEGTSTRFTIGPQDVVMSREGKMSTRMVFEEGKKHLFLYETPYGAATMGVNTNKVTHHMGEHGGEMEIDYVVDFDHTVVGRNNFKISVKEVKKDDVRCQI